MLEFTEKLLLLVFNIMLISFALAFVIAVSFLVYDLIKDKINKKWKMNFIYKEWWVNVFVVTIILVIIFSSVVPAMYVEYHMYGKNKTEPLYERRVYFNNYLKFGDNRQRHVRVLLFLFPLAIVILKIFSLNKQSKKEFVKLANSIYKCRRCKKYNRGYQMALVSEQEGGCVHCGSLDLMPAELNDELKYFLDSHPECPELNYRDIMLHTNYFIAKLNKENVYITNDEVERLMKSYEETGNLYIKKLYEKGEY